MPAQLSLLLVLPQLPLDSGSGAARSLTTICEMAASAGYRVRALATTATEPALKLDTVDYLRSLGFRVDRSRKPGERPELDRRKARRQGVRVVSGLRNMGYLAPGGLDEVDAILASSRFLADRYRQVLLVESTALPLPLEMDDVIATDCQPVLVTMINPSPEKGLMVFVRIAEEVSRRRSRVALLVIESRGSAGRLAGAALAGGLRSVPQ
jgi:hypothetical protein